MHFDQDMRRQTNQGVSIRVDRGDPRTDQVMKQVNEEGFLDDLKIASKDANSEEAKRIRKTILPLVKLFGSKIKWSPMERKSSLSKHYALYHAFGLPFLFGTISPGMRNSPLALRMCKSTGSLFDNSIGQVVFPEIVLNTVHARDKMISKNLYLRLESLTLSLTHFFQKSWVSRCHY